MRIIAGTARGRRLSAPRGTQTRPTSDRVRESIFNILLARGPVPSRVLDLYAGSGALGLEALSRGAERAVMVDEDAGAATVMRDNARALGFEAAAQIATSRVAEWLRRAPSEKFGWVFLDPPYAVAARELGRALALLDERALVEPGGLAIAEHDWHDAPVEQHGGLALLDSRRYGQTAVSIYEART